MLNNTKNDIQTQTSRDNSERKNNVSIEDYQRYIKRMIDEIENEKKLKSIYRMTLKYYLNG